MLQRIIYEADELKKELVEIRRNLHSKAECGFQLYETNDFIKSKLMEYGYLPEKCGKSGISVNIGTEKGSTVLLRADTDALPIKEETNLHFSSKNNMHACGHDMHTAMLLGCAKLLKAHERNLSRGVKMLFQPAEETLQGAKDCIDCGILKTPDVYSAFMIHTLTGVALPSGCIIVSSGGVSTTQAQFFKINIHGKSSHGAMQADGVDSIFPASQIITGLKQMVCTEIAPENESMLSIGIVKGGVAPNVIADLTVIEGSFRATASSAMGQIKNRIEEIAKAICDGYKCEVDVIFEGYAPQLKNDFDYSAKFEKLLKTNLQNVYTSNELQKNSSKRLGGSEDFAVFSQEVPSLMVAISAGDTAKGYDYPLHHPKALFDESVLPLGAAIYAINGFI